MDFAARFAMNRANIIRGNKIEKAKIISQIDKIESTDLSSLSGIGETTVTALLEGGISSLEDLQNTDIETIKKLKINPFSFKRIEKFINK